MGPILLVDDNYDFRLSVRDLLERQGYHVVSVAKKDHTLHTVLRRSISLIITDLNLPAASGFELTRRLRAMAGDLPPIIALATCEFLAREETRVASEALGARVVLSKPLDADVLLAAIANALTDGSGQWQARLDEESML